MVYAHYLHHGHYTGKNYPEIEIDVSYLGADGSALVGLSNIFATLNQSIQNKLTLEAFISLAHWWRSERSRLK